jgi:hypothetical protein
MLFLNNDKQVTLWEVKSCHQNLLSKGLIKHANKVLRQGLWVLMQEFWKDKSGEEILSKVVLKKKKSKG